MQLKSYRSVVRAVNYLSILLGLTVVSINPAVASLFYIRWLQVGDGVKNTPSISGLLCQNFAAITSTSWNTKMTAILDSPLSVGYILSSPLLPVVDGRMTISYRVTIAGPAYPVNGAPAADQHRLPLMTACLPLAAPLRLAPPPHLGWVLGES